MLVLLASGGAHQTGWLTGVLLEFARGGAEWILWLLVLLSLVSVMLFVERMLFYKKLSSDAFLLRKMLMEMVPQGRIDEALEALNGDESMAAHVIANGLRDAERGPKAVEELCRGALGMEKLRYERGLSWLATIGSNAPFVGLFGTVMGVIMAFDAMTGDALSTGDSSGRVMAAIAEALVATGVGLLVAIPAILFFNLCKERVKREATQTVLLVETLVAYLRGTEFGGECTASMKSAAE